jgi:hypothetical protein
VHVEHNTTSDVYLRGVPLDKLEREGAALCHAGKEFASTTSCSPTQVRADTLMRSEVQAGWRMARMFLTYAATLAE